MMRITICILVGLAVFWYVGYNYAGVKHGSQAALLYRAEVNSTILAGMMRSRSGDRAEFWRLLRNNLRIDGGILLGTITGGFWGAIALATNATKSGTLFATAKAADLPMWFYTRHVVLHAIPEYAGYAMAEIAAANTGWRLFQSVRGAKLSIPARIPVIGIASMFLIAFAAFIEAYVSPHL